MKVGFYSLFIELYLKHNSLTVHYFLTAFLQQDNVTEKQLVYI